MPLEVESKHKRLVSDGWIAVLFALAGCIYLLTRTALPPYGTPLNELSDHYWGLLIDIARKWRSGFYFWDRAIGGGYCLFSSGFYPLLSPGNIFAKFLTDDHFYISRVQ